MSCKSRQRLMDLRTAHGFPSRATVRGRGIVRRRGRMLSVHIRSHSGSPTLSQLQEMHRQSPSSPQRLEFVTSYGSWLVCDRVDEFLRGATAFRNGLEWARQRRNEAIARANRRVEAGTQFGAHARPTDLEGAETCGPASQSSADPIS